jgi:ubiquinone/menaquinone biosynthesis C-methylase UbiE
MDTWKNKNTIDFWRHKRMYENLNPLVHNYPEASWLTVGDGRYGTDANYLLSEGAKKVLATDISDFYLKIASEDNFIREYKAENAESLSFADNTFDFSLCKESYHHFPRPMIALYEMLRVSKEAIVFIEPNDPIMLNPFRAQVRTFGKWLLQGMKNKVKKLIGKELYLGKENYEPSGNYVYTISEREMEKIALGLNLPAVAFKGLNDYYIDGVEFEEANEQSALFKKIKYNVEKENRRVKSGKAHYGILVAIIFKNLPNEKTIAELKKYDFDVRILPRNPYVH